MPIPGHISEENHNLKRYMPRKVHCSIIYDSQAWKQPKCPSTEEWIYICESLCCIPETNTTLYINYTSI